MKVAQSLIKLWIGSILIFQGLFLQGSWASGLKDSMVEVEKIRKKHFPGGPDEEELRVLSALPEASRRMDRTSVQREVYKSLYHQDLGEQEREPDSETEN